MRYYFIMTKYLMIAWCLFRYLTGQVDKRTLEKYEREAKEKNRETWLVYQFKCIVWFRILLIILRRKGELFSLLSHWISFY